MSLKLFHRDAAIPCTVLILGGNLTKGTAPCHKANNHMRHPYASRVYVCNAGLSGIGKTVIEPVVVISIVAIRYFVLATKLGFLPRSPLYRYVLLLQSTVPPAMSIGNANSASVVSIRDALYLRADVPPLR